MPNVHVPVGDGSNHEIPFDVPVAYGLDSVHKKPTNRLVLVLFPTKQVPYRGSVIATNPNHDVWKIDNGEDMRKWFAKAFPRFNFLDESLVEAGEWERFAKSEGVRFPPCQLCPAMCTSNGNCAILLIGDSVHAFPPDMGEGINCALADVAALDDAMGNNKDDLKAALEEYERVRLPEVKLESFHVRDDHAFVNPLTQPFRTGKSVGSNVSICSTLSIRASHRFAENPSHVLAVQCDSTNLTQQTFLWALASTSHFFEE
jgi:2-polyprenyl-6-methoxyphenol hydroxylase-like FAD-dependent oxidoreductase